MVKIEISGNNPLRYQTVGLAETGNLELTSAVLDSALADGNHRFLAFVARYLDREQTRIVDGQTLAYGYWTTCFRKNEFSMLDTWEHDPSDLTFRKGVSFAVDCWERQTGACRKYRAPFMPPRPDQFMMIDAKALFEPGPVEAVRYPAPLHMSGWWINSIGFKGSVADMRREHLHHFTKLRPELLDFLALPFGTRFKYENGMKAWLDPIVANSKPI